MQSYFNLISHPDRTLQEHLDRCNSISEKLLEMKYISENFYSKQELQYWRLIINYFHDFGKATDFFQSKIIEAAEKRNIESFISQNKNYIENFKQNKNHKIKELLFHDPTLSNHAQLGAYMALCNKISEDQIIEIIVLEIILKHHGHLTNFMYTGEEPFVLLDEDKIEKLSRQLSNLSLSLYEKIIEPHHLIVNFDKWENIKNKFSSLRSLEKIKELLKQKTNKYFFLQHFLYSLLLSADKGDMMLAKDEDTSHFIKENIALPVDIIDKFKKNEFKDTIKKPIDYEREKAYQNIVNNCIKYFDKNFYSITLPTGLGKTFSAYNAAIRLQESYKKQTGIIPRIIYCLPFTSIIDQNAEIISSIFKNEGLSETLIAKHHYLSDFNDKYDKTELTFEAGEYLTEGWEHDFIVTTFIQLFESIFTNRNRALRKFHNITNSIVILDEIQNVPPIYYEAIEYVFTGMAKYFNTKFIFVTATQPIIFSETPVLELTDPTKKLTRIFFENRDRITIDQTLLKKFDYKPVEIENLIELFKRDIESNFDKSFLFIFNTIAQSQIVFKQLSIYNNLEVCVLYLSGSILPRRRKQIINLIKRNIKYGKRQIIVSTQVVEAGIDIDLDIVYRDLAPLDCINQSAGRCNRNGINKKGLVKLFNSGKSQYIYDSTLLNITEKILKEYSKYSLIIEEKQFYELNQKYFLKIHEAMSEYSDKSKDLIKAINNLQLENIEKEFKLIKEENYYYNVFISYNKYAVMTWRKYMEYFKIKNDFERKKAIKKIKPKLMQYMTRFPKVNFIPSEKDRDKLIINLENWQEYYDLVSGFKFGNIESNVIIL